MKLVLLFAVFVVLAGAVEVRKARDWNRGSYIVSLRQGIATKGSHQRDQLKREILNMDPVNTIDVEWTLINAFAAHMSLETVEKLTHLDDEIALIEEDGMAYANLDCPASTTPRAGAWGIARTSEPDCSANPTTYFHPSNPGQGTVNYILDTGIRATHEQFAGRTLTGASFIAAEPDPYDDRNGHGSHVAGTVAGDTVGLAFAGELVAVKVLGGSGSGAWTGVISGIEWATKDAEDRGLLCTDSGSCASTINMSLGGGVNTAVNNAVDASDIAGMINVISAGNNNGNACNNSPAGAQRAFTIGSTTESNARSSFSNFGACVDIFAPGSSILSAGYTSDTSYRTLSGTSMSAPHVAGVCALFQAENSYSSTSALRDAVVGAAHDDCVGNPGSGSPNKLAFSC